MAATVATAATGCHQECLHRPLFHTSPHNKQITVDGDTSTNDCSIFSERFAGNAISPTLADE
jgi:N-acetylglutamate synthase/N-acetylornithine aminotransferase